MAASAAGDRNCHRGGSERRERSLHWNPLRSLGAGRRRALPASAYAEVGMTRAAAGRSHRVKRRREGKSHMGATSGRPPRRTRRGASSTRRLPPGITRSRGMPFPRRGSFSRSDRPDRGSPGGPVPVGRDRDPRCESDLRRRFSGRLRASHHPRWRAQSRSAAGSSRRRTPSIDPARLRPCTGSRQMSGSGKSRYRSSRPRSGRLCPRSTASSCSHRRDRRRLRPAPPGSSTPPRCQRTRSAGLPAGSSPEPPIPHSTD